MAKELNLEDGIQEAIRAISNVDERPILVAVYGWPDSGKSYLISKLKEHFEAKGLSVTGAGGGPLPSTFERLRDYLDCFADLVLFHCGWNRTPKAIEKILGDFSERAREDPNILAERIANRKVNLNIGMYNPRFYPKPDGEYDLIMSNPDSVKKNAW